MNDPSDNMATAVWKMLKPWVIGLGLLCAAILFIVGAAVGIVVGAAVWQFGW